MPVTKRPRAKNMNNIDMSRIIQVVKPNVKFKNIIGCELAKTFLKDFCFSLKNEDEYYNNFGCQLPQSVLMHGPPGNGKNSLARALCYNTNALFYNVNITDIVNKWFSESEKNLEAIFLDAVHRSADEKCPVIIFFRNVDAIFCPPDQFSRDGLSLRLSQVLCELMSGTIRNKNVYVLGRTCHLENVHPDVRNRFNYKLEVKNPNNEEKIEFLEKLKNITYQRCTKTLDKTNWIHADFSKIAEETDNHSNYSYFELAVMFNETLRQKAIEWKNSDSRANFREDKLETVSTEDFIKIISDNTYIS